MSYLHPSSTKPGIRIEGDAICLTASETIGQLAAAAAAANAPQLPLFQGALSGRIALAMLDRPEATLPTQLIKRNKRPLVLVIGDDPWPAAESVGPDNWTCALKLRRWIGNGPVMVHGGAGKIEHYRTALETAAKMGRCVLIETDSCHWRPWAEFIASPRMLIIAPPDGRPHPVAPSREAMH